MENKRTMNAIAVTVFAVGILSMAIAYTLQDKGDDCTNVERAVAAHNVDVDCGE